MHREGEDAAVVSGPAQLIRTSLGHYQEDGQGLAEYAIILALIAVVAIASLIFLGDVINDLMSTIGDTVDHNT